MNVVNVRWWDGYLETFTCNEVRFGVDLLWMRLDTGENRHIPTRHVRWYSTSIESHANQPDPEAPYQYSGEAAPPEQSTPPDTPPTPPA